VLDSKNPLLKNVAKESTVWMNHGDEIVKLPDDFEVIGLTDHVPYTCAVSKKRNIYGILFHPEVEHTDFGMQILQNFLEICQSQKSVVKSQKNEIATASLSPRNDELNPEIMIKQIKQTVGSAHVIGAVSGGVDSTVAATLVAKAIGKQFTPIFVNNGLMRDDAVISVQNLFKRFDITPVIIECEEEMVKKLAGITDSEEKRKVIGNFYIEVFERELEKILESSHSEASAIESQQNRPYQSANASFQDDNEDVFLLQGTIYSDVIESQGTKHASKIKSHHNVGGLPEHMKLKLLEPLRELYKDEVRSLGKELGLPEEFVQKQPFPGPGFAVRIRGEVTKERLMQEKHADKIVLEELKSAGWLEKVFISFPVMTGADSTAVKGDGKFMGEVIALRVVESKDIMTATWAKLPYELLQKISSRIVNEVPNISRVVYDISTKPPATMEWE
jgi:GMP synthase (glutamine-hydrolysing)